MITAQVRFDEEEQRCVVEPIEMTQEFRKFDFSTPWETFPAYRQLDSSDKDSREKDSREKDSSTNN